MKGPGEAPVRPRRFATRVRFQQQREDATGRFTTAAVAAFLARGYTSEVASQQRNQGPFSASSPPIRPSRFSLNSEPYGIPRKSNADITRTASPPGPSPASIYADSIKSPGTPVQWALLPTASQRRLAPRSRELHFSLFSPCRSNSVPWFTSRFDANIRNQRERERERGQRKREDGKKRRAWLGRERNRARRGETRAHDDPVSFHGSE